MPVLPPSVTMSELIARYDTLLFDAYGVLISNHAVLPHAPALIEHLEATAKPYFIVTNGSRNSPADTAKRYQKFGLAIPTERVITSGSLVAAWIRQHGYESARFRILGPPDCAYMLADFPQASLAPAGSDDFDVLIIGNQDGFDLRATVDQVISALFNRFDRGAATALLLPNPDLIYPDSETSYGLTGGMVALMIEAALKVRFPLAAYRFESLGKPYAPIFDAARTRAHGRLVMVGDQMLTDIRGALDAKIDAVLIGTGLARIDEEGTYHEFSPTFRMRDLAL